MTERYKFREGDAVQLKYAPWHVGIVTSLSSLWPREPPDVRVLWIAPTVRMLELTYLPERLKLYDRAI